MAPRAPRVGVWAYGPPLALAFHYSIPLEILTATEFFLRSVDVYVPEI